MINKIKGMRIAGAVLSLFLAGKSVQALTPENFSEIKTAFESDKQTYLILQDGSITPTDKEEKIVLGKDGKWISSNEKVMSAQFQNEAEKVLKVEKEKENRGIKLIDFFEYPKKDANCYNLWSDKTITCGSNQFIDKEGWFYDANKNGQFDKGDGYMSDLFNAEADIRMIIGLNELVALREEKRKSEKENAKAESKLATITSCPALSNQNIPYDKIEKIKDNDQFSPKDLVALTNSTKTKKIKTGLSIIAQPITDLKFEKKGASVGLGYDFGNFGFRVLGNFSVNPDTIIKTYKGTVSERTGRYAEGETAEIQKLSFGAGLETRLGFLIAGGGFNYDTEIQKSDVRIMKGTNILSSNTSSTAYNNFSWNAYAGVEIPVTSWLKLGAVAGYDEQSRLFGGLRGTFTIPLQDISVKILSKEDNKQKPSDSAFNLQKRTEKGRN